MPVNMPLAAVIEMGGLDYLPPEFVQLVAACEERLYGPVREPVAAPAAVPAGGPEEEPESEPPPASEPDWAGCAPLTDWLTENSEPDFANGIRLMVRRKLLPTRKPGYGGKPYFAWANPPRHLSELNYEHADTFLGAVAKLAKLIGEVRVEMGG